MKAWWRTEPLTPEESSLLDAVLTAHHWSTFRFNASTVTVTQVADSSGDLNKAIAAGILTMGGKHAPLERTHRFLSLAEPGREVSRILKMGDKVPGWGGTFQKNEPDPLWAEVSVILAKTQPDISAKIDSVTTELHRCGKQIHPNPSAYTASTAIALGMPANLAAYLFIIGRLMAWAQIAAEQLKKEG